MKSSIITSLVGLAFFCACSAEDLTTSGLDPVPTSTGNATPTTTTEPNQPSNTPSSTSTSPGTGDMPTPDLMPTGTPTSTQTAGGTQDPPATTSTADPDDTTMEPPADVPLTPGEVGGQLEGFLYLGPCQGPDAGHDCTVPQCPGGANRDLTQNLQLGGKPGTIYDITIHVYGVVEPREYAGGMRRAGNNFDVNGNDFFYIGGQVPTNIGTYNTYELHVTPPVQGEPANDFFLNSRIGTAVPALVRLDYTATFAVPGGGVIRWRSFDLNCRQITNCNTTECGTLGPKPVTQDSVRNANPPPPASFTQPYRGNAGSGLGQWIYIDVTDAKPRP